MPHCTQSSSMHANALALQGFPAQPTHLKVVFPMHAARISKTSSAGVGALSQQLRSETVRLSSSSFPTPPSTPPDGCGSSGGRVRWMGRRVVGRVGGRGVGADSRKKGNISMACHNCFQGGKRSGEANDGAALAEAQIKTKNSKGSHGPVLCTTSVVTADF